MGMRKKNAPGCCACKKGTCTNAKACWVFTDCFADDLTSANPVASVVGPDGKPVAATITRVGNSTRVCAPVDRLGTYTLTFSSDLTFPHTTSTPVTTCTPAAVPITLRARRFLVSVLGCPWRDGDGTSHVGVPGATVTVSNGSASGTATTNAAGLAYVPLGGSEWPDSATWSISASKDRYQAATVGAMGVACSATVNLDPATCYTCPDCSVANDARIGCPAPQFDSGTLTTPFGAKCVRIGVSYPAAFFVPVEGLQERVNGANDQTCFSPLGPITTPLTVMAGGSSCILVGYPVCYQSRICNGSLVSYPRSGSNNGTSDFVYLPIGATSKSCEPFTLEGSVSYSDDCPGRTWLNGTYSFVSNNCDCSGSYGTDTTPQVAANEPPQYQTLDRPGDLDRELIVARYTEDTSWVEGLAA